MSQSILVMSWIVVIILCIACRLMITFRSKNNRQLELEDFLKIITSASAL